MSGLGSLPRSALALLDVLVSDFPAAAVVARWRVAARGGMHERTARRAFHTLHTWGLVELPGCDGGADFANCGVRATALGRALIEARYASEVAA